MTYDERQGGICYGCGCEVGPGEGWLVEGRVLCEDCANSYYDDEDELEKKEEDDD